MTQTSLAAVLKQLQQSENDATQLLRFYERAEYAAFWQADARLHQRFVRRLLGEGHPARAFELAREGLARHADDHELQFLRALALARGGNASKAAEGAQMLLQTPNLNRVLEGETLSLLGRIFKDRYERAPVSQRAKRRKLAQESAAFYLLAFQKTRASFSCINAATMSLLAGEKERARELATQAIECAEAELKTRGRRNDAWLLATLGEANLILGEVFFSENWYRQAAQIAKNRRGDLASMRRNVALLQAATGKGQRLNEILGCGCVVVFMADELGLSARVGETEKVLRDAIAQKLENLNADIGFCFPCGALEILFAETLLARGGELHLVLPMEREDFGFGEHLWEGNAISWRARFDKVVQSATQIHEVTRENFLHDEVLRSFASTVMQGLALTCARELNAKVCALVSASATQSSTRSAPNDAMQGAAQWNAIARLPSNCANTNIEPAEIVEFSGLAKAQKKFVQSKTVARKPDGHKARRVKAMLFADVKNFSKLSEEQTPAFFVTFLDKVAREIAGLKRRPAFANTWGDGLFLVFDSASDCAGFALRLLEQIENTDWTTVGLPRDTTVRIGLHAGPVYAARDKIIGRTNFFGAHVNRAARIEPVTTPGCAFATEQFAALLAVEAGEIFRCEYVGIEELAKGYDKCALYRLS